MPRPRKTLDVAELKVRVNRALTDAADHQDATKGVASAQQYRLGLAAVLEDALTTTGNYHGFRYTDTNAQRSDDGYLIDGTYDETRRAYF